ncbi:MAG: tetratricopeptide repeat protein, partial [Candidatus Sumerlaeia bacterium]|nr:tetratricopeptide repeat protein [Candidatus Sumerlaeia bacterium]
KTEQFEKSIEAYKKSVMLKPDAWTYARLGWVYTALKQYDSALEQFEKSVQLEPNTYFYWNYLGITYSQLENTAKAIECYEKSLQINPEQNDIKKTLETLKKKML